MEPSQYPSFPILMVDDEEHLLFSFDTILRSNGIDNIISCTDSRKVSSILSQNQISLILLDLFMPHVKGEQILEQVSRDYPDIPIIIITGVDAVNTAVRCIKTGAFDYMVKPVEEGRLLTSVMRALEFCDLRVENRSLKNQLFAGKIENPDSFAGIVTKDKTMFSIFQYSEAIAKSPMPVLITGETGTGKEMMVQSIHQIGSHKGELVKINVAGLDDNMFSDTLFGHKKGAYTGAESHRPGLVQQAARGTLFLDEIGELSVPSQVKLLRLLQNREYYPIGSDETEFSDARIIVATNHSLEDLYQLETFRKDLYYRLQTHHIHIPPLRERAGDIPILLDYFLDQASKTLDKKKPSVPNELPLLLGTYHFPGNIREMQSMVFDAVSKHESKILSMVSFKDYISKTASSKPIEMGKSQQTNPFSNLTTLPTLKQSENNLITEALERSNGNQSIAARILGISRQALNRRVQSKN